jgi:hypothetical protein
MLNTAFDLGQELHSRTLPFKLYQPMWVKYDFSPLDLSLVNWTTIKYLNKSGTNFHSDIRKIPNNKGGLYMFSINCPVIPGSTEFPVYIGRAQLTKRQNLRKRCREYYTKFARDNERPLITRMFKYWSDDLYLSFITLDTNAEIIDYEKKLINSLLLPFNHEIPDVEIRQAVQAFNL